MSVIAMKGAEQVVFSVTLLRPVLFTKVLCGRWGGGREDSKL